MPENTEPRDSTNSSLSSIFWATRSVPQPVVDETAEASSGGCGCGGSTPKPKHNHHHHHHHEHKHRATAETTDEIEI
jgi:hypothetical protein